MPEEIVTPVVETPITTPEPTTVETPVEVKTETPVETPVETPTTETPVETKPEESKPETILGEALDKDKPEQKESETSKTEAKTEEADKTASEETKTDEGQTEEPAPPPVYEDFTVPEGVTLDTEQVKEFTNLLSDLEVKSKADHALMQEFGQKAVDFHVAQLTKAAEDLTKFYQKTWEKQKTDWKEAFLKDPEIGGNRFQTTVDAALTFIRTHGGTPEQQAEFQALMESSGLGNHPAMIRLFANASRAMSEGRPLAAQTPVQPTKSKVSTLYGKS